MRANTVRPLFQIFAGIYPIREWFFIAHDTELGIDFRQLAGIKNHSAANGSALRSVAMESFNYENSTGLKGALEDRRHLTTSHITEKDHIPPPLSKIKVFHPFNCGIEMHSQLSRIFLSESDSLFGGIETSDVPLSRACQRDARGRVAATVL